MKRGPRKWALLFLGDSEYQARNPSPRRHNAGAFRVWRGKAPRKIDGWARTENSKATAKTPAKDLAKTPHVTPTCGLPKSNGKPAQSSGLTRNRSAERAIDRREAASATPRRCGELYGFKGIAMRSAAVIQPWNNPVGYDPCIETLKKQLTRGWNKR